METKLLRRQDEPTIGHVDQASGLRTVTSRERSAQPAVQVVAVSSGKGGVGKTNIVVNLAVACAKEGREVLVMDADLALGNVDILLGLVPSYTIEDVLSGEREMEEVLVRGPSGIRILPASSGVQELTDLTYEQQRRFLPAFFNWITLQICCSLIVQLEFPPM